MPTIELLNYHTSFKIQASLTTGNGLQGLQILELWCGLGFSKPWWHLNVCCWRGPMLLQLLWLGLLMSFPPLDRLFHIWSPTQINAVGFLQSRNIVKIYVFC